MLCARPRVAKVDKQPLNFVLGKDDFVELLHVVVNQQKVVNFLSACFIKQLYNGAPSHAEHVDFDVQRDDVALGIPQRKLTGKAALAAADFQIERLFFLKCLPPFSGVLLGVFDKEIADAQLRLRPFFLSDSHSTSIVKSISFYYTKL